MRFVLFLRGILGRIIFVVVELHLIWLLFIIISTIPGCRIFLIFGIYCSIR
jgi:hypothetical protein